MVLTRATTRQLGEQKERFEEIAKNRDSPALPRSFDDLHKEVFEEKSMRFSSSHRGWRLSEFEGFERLGEGGMGTVYKATHKETGRFAALKLIELEHYHTYRYAKQEVEVHESLDHPLVVKSYGHIICMSESIPDSLGHIESTCDGSPPPDAFRGCSESSSDENSPPNENTGLNLLNASPSISANTKSSTRLSGFSGDDHSLSSGRESFSGSTSESESELLAAWVDCITSEMERPSVSSSCKLGIILILELCPNGTLHSLQESKPDGRFSEKQAAQYASSIASVLAYLHKEKKVIHRDIKPHNILISDDMMLKIADFGISVRDSELRRKTCIGTPGFMAPEMRQVVKKSRWLDGHYDERVDLFSLGVLVNTMLVGSLPFSDLYHSTLEFERTPTVRRDKEDIFGIWQYVGKTAARRMIDDLDLDVPLEVLDHSLPSEDYWKPAFSIEDLDLFLPPLEFPAFLSEDATDFLQNLLQANPEDRMSLGDVEDHKWIKKYM